MSPKQTLKQAVVYSGHRGNDIDDTLIRCVSMQMIFSTGNKREKCHILLCLSSVMFVCVCVLVCACARACVSVRHRALKDAWAKAGVPECTCAVSADCVVEDYDADNELLKPCAPKHSGMCVHTAMCYL